MSTQVVRHKSRIVTEDLQFTANGETSWSFVAEGDGEIYSVENNNVASYTINGGAVTLPYALVNGNSYTVAITKATGGQVADIQLKTRRAVDKTKSVNVPDYSQFNGRYLYILNDNNQVEKHDTNVRQPSNYTGSGTWDSTSIVETINLPTLPANFSYREICFINEGATEKLVVIAANNTSISATSYWSKIIGSNVYDMTETTPDSYTTVTLSGSNFNGGAFIHSYFDYINNLLYVTFHNNTHHTIVYDLSNDTYVSRLSDTAVGQAFDLMRNPRKSMTLIPDVSITTGYRGVSDLISESNGKWLNGYGGGHDRDDGFIVTSKVGTVGTQLVKYNRDGVQQQLIAASPTVAASNQGSWLYSTTLGQGFVSTTLNTRETFGLYRKSDNLFSLYTLQDNLGAYYVGDRCCSEFSGLWFFCQFPSDEVTTRLHFAKIDQTPFDYAYEDFPNGVRGIVTNQLIA